MPEFLATNFHNYDHQVRPPPPNGDFNRLEDYTPDILDVVSDALLCAGAVSLDIRSQELALLYDHDSLYTLPKGPKLDGESPEACALRVGADRTKVVTRIFSAVRKHPSWKEYDVPFTVQRTIRKDRGFRRSIFWYAIEVSKPASQSVTLEPPGEEELLQVRWVNAMHAPLLMSSSIEREVVELALRDFPISRAPSYTRKNPRRNIGIGTVLPSYNVCHGHHMPAAPRPPTSPKREAFPSVGAEYLGPDPLLTLEPKARVPEQTASAPLEAPHKTPPIKQRRRALWPPIHDIQNSDATAPKSSFHSHPKSYFAEVATGKIPVNLELPEESSVLYAGGEWKRFVWQRAAVKQSDRDSITAELNAVPLIRWYFPKGSVQEVLGADDTHLL